MKFIYKLCIVLVIVLAGLSVINCKGTRVHAGVGLNVDFGPNGARVHPNMNVNIYNGGRY